MFNRVNDLFIITVNNLQALKAVSELVYEMLKCRYVIQIEQFPNMTVYRICIPMREDFDSKVSKKITEYLELRNLQLMEDSL